MEGSQFNDVDIDFEIVANSQIPQTPYQQKDSLAQLLQFTGGVGGLLEATAMNPDITGDIVRAFGAKLSIPNKVDIARVCRRRIEQAKKLLELELKNQKLMAAIGLPADNTNLAAAIVSQLTPPISPKEPYAEQKAAWMAQLLDADEMNYAPQELRYILEEMIDRQIQTATLGRAQIEQDANLGLAMANLPLLVGEQAMNQQNQQLEQQFAQAQEQQKVQQAQQNAQAQAQAQAQLAQQQAGMDAEQADAEHQRTLELNADEHARNLQLKGIEHLSAIEQAKVQAQNRPKPSGAKK